MKILMYARLVGGIANHVFFLSKELKRLGYEISIISQKEIPSIKILDGFYYLDSPLAIKKLLNVCKDYSILHVHNTATSSEVFIPKLVKIPIVNTIHTAVGDNIYGKIGYEVTKKIAKIYSNSRATVALSKKSMKVLKDYQKNVRLIPNGVDAEIFKPKKAKRIFDGITIGYLGQLRREKNIESLAKACKKFGFNLAIAGVGPLFKRIKDMECRNIRVLGFVKDAVEFYNSIDIFVLPSYAENDPLTILEAMACGKPIVATKCVDYVKDDFGLTCDYDFKSIGDAIEEILKMDYKKMGINARKYVLKHRTWKKCATEVEKIYKSILN